MYYSPRSTVMSDWVESYLADDGDRSRRAMRISDLSVQGAPIAFRILASRIKSDVRKLESATRCGVRYEFSPSTKFVVRSSSGRLPFARIDVELIGLDIVCTRTRKLDSTCSPEDLPLLRFRICSDLMGNVQIMKNGTPFEDESELSQELLGPLFDYLREIPASHLSEVAAS